MQQQIQRLIKNDNSALEEIRFVPFSQYMPTMDLPGELNGKKLEFLQVASHWIIAKMVGVGNGQSKLSMELTFAAGEVGGTWKIMGSRYQPE